ncbi:MAG: LPS export ABC transporter periplasmic protein LptC [Pyrinomonadaceae bacterium]
MSAEIAHNHTNYQLRSKLPQYIRFAAIVAMAVTIIAVGVGFYRERSKSAFRLKSEHTQLSTDVVAEVNGYERSETEDGVTKYHITADHAKTFSDDHQELTNVNLELFDKEGIPTEKMTAHEALYIPEQNKNFTAYLKGNVQIGTRDELNIKTEHIAYTRVNETAEADEHVEFDRGTVKGKSLGATVKMVERELDLLKNVEIEMFETPELVKSGVRYGKLNSGSATYDQKANRIDLRDGTAIELLSKGRTAGSTTTTNVNSARASVNLIGEAGKSMQIKTLEMFDTVHIISNESGRPPTDIDAGYVLYDKPADSFALKNGAHIVTAAQDKSTDIRAAEIDYDRLHGHLQLGGGAEILQGSDQIKGDVITAKLFPDNKLKSAVARGSGFARQTGTERTTTITAPELNASYDDQGQLRDANAIGQSTAEIVAKGNAEYSTAFMSAAKGIGLTFKGEGLIEAMRTDGRTSIQLNAPDTGPGSANKRVTADVVRTRFAANGKDIQKAEAVGDAEISVDPLHSGPENYKTTINAPRFDCEFFATGNNAKTCVGGKKAKSVRVPTVAKEGRGTQTLTTDQITAEFDPKTHDVEMLEADGNSKFNELDRTAIAKQITYASTGQVVRLRGGEPTVWDSAARAKAREIDWDTKNNRSSLRGSVSTTYYSQKQMKGSSPFGSPDKPVFITAEIAEIDHRAEKAVYNVNARGWQGENYVRGDRITVDQPAGKFLAEGDVHSLLYNAKLKKDGKDSTVPTSAAAASMNYERDTHILQYRTNVDIRQGTDRITAGSADVYMSENNEVAKTIAETDVVITQPARRATASWLQYTTADEIAVLRGSPATVTDAENGSSQSAQITVHMRDNRVLSDGKTKQVQAGRSRSVYKVKPTQ